MKLQAVLAFSASLGLLSETSAPAQTHFEQRSQTIEKDVAAIPDSTTATIVMLGDSITEQFSTTESLPPEILDFPVVNQGIGGDTIGTSTSKTGVMSRLDFVKQARPSVVFVMIGINELWDKEGNADQAIRNYEAMVPALKSAVPQAKIVLQSVLPARGDASYTNVKSAKLNERIHELAREHGALWLDLRPKFQDEKGELKAEYTNDGVHLTKEGYAVWLEKLKEVAAQLIK